MDEKGVDPYKDVLTLEQYRALFGYTTHPFNRRGLCGLLLQLDPGVRRRGGGHLRQRSPGHPALHQDRPGLRHPHPCPHQAPPALRRRGEGVLPGRDPSTPRWAAAATTPSTALQGSNKSTEDKVKLFPPGGVPATGGGRAGPHPEGDRQARGGLGLRRRRLQGSRGQESGSWPTRWSPPPTPPAWRAPPTSSSSSIWRTTTLPTCPARPCGTPIKGEIKTEKDGPWSASGRPGHHPPAAHRQIGSLWTFLCLGTASERAGRGRGKMPSAETSAKLN